MARTKTQDGNWWDRLLGLDKNRADEDAKIVADAQAVFNDAVAAKVENRTPNYPGEIVIDSLDELGLTVGDIDRAAAEKIETDRLLHLATVEKAEATRQLSTIKAELTELQRDHREAEKQYRSDLGRLESRKDQALAKLSECSQAESAIKSRASSTAKSAHQDAIKSVADCKRRISNAELELREARRQVDHWTLEVSRFNNGFQRDSRADEARAELAKWNDDVDRLSKELRNAPNELAALEQAAKDADRDLVQITQIRNSNNGNYEYGKYVERDLR